FSSKLAEGLSIVERSPQSAPDQLAIIEAEGEKLRGKQSQQAADLVSTRLAATIRAEVEQSEGRAVRSVDGETAQHKDGSWAVTRVKVLFEGEESAEESQAGGDIAVIKEIEPISDVDIQVEVGGATSDDQDDESGSDENTDETKQVLAEQSSLDPKT